MQALPRGSAQGRTAQEPLPEQPPQATQTQEEQHTMYEPGTLLFYGSTGVCRVVEQTQREFPGMPSALYYQLEPLYQTGVIYAPVEGGRVFFRPVISAQEVDRLIDSIPELEAQDCQGSMQQLTERYQGAVRSHDCAHLLALSTSIYAKKQEMARRQRRFGQLDERYLKQAEDLLFGEFAAALGIARDAVQGYIAARLSAQEQAAQ